MVNPKPAKRMGRRQAVERLLADRGDALVVTGLGSPTYDAAVADACGFVATSVLNTIGQVDSAAKQIGNSGLGPRLFVLKVEPEAPPRSLPSRDAIHIKNRFRAYLGLGPC